MLRSCLGKKPPPPQSPRPLTQVLPFLFKLITPVAPSTSSTTPGTSVTSSPTPTITSASSASSASSAQPFVSVESGGSITTVTPSGTTSLVLSPTGTFSINGTNTTISACTPDNYALDGAAQPFCVPANGSAWIKNTSYPVTWNPDFWPGYKGNIVLAMLYTGSDGSNVIFQNKDIANSQGYFVVDVSEDWLNGKEVVAAKFLIAPSDPTANGGAHWGPIVTLQGTPSESLSPLDLSPLSLPQPLLFPL